MLYRIFEYSILCFHILCSNVELIYRTPRLSINQSIYLSISPSINLCIYSCVYLFIYLYIYRSICVFTYASIKEQVCLTIYQYMCLFINLPPHLSIYLCISPFIYVSIHSFRPLIPSPVPFPVTNFFSSFHVGQESSKETVQQIVRALNIVLLRLAAEAPSGYVMGSLIQVLFLCIPSNEVDHTV